MEPTVTELKSEAYDLICKIQAYLNEVERLKLQLSQLNEKINAAGN